MRTILLPAFFISVCISCACNNAADSNGQPKNDSQDVKFTPPVIVKDTVNHPRPVSASGDGSLHLTAENGKAVGPEIKYMPEWNAFGWFTAKDRVEWEVNVPKAGIYDVEMEWSVDDKEAGKEFYLEAGKVVMTGTVGKTGSWETFSIEKVGQIILPEGKQFLVFRSKTDFNEGALLDLRALKLIPVN